MSDIKICVVGAGDWGQNHIKTLLELDALGGIVDVNRKQRKNRYIMKVEK